MITRMSSTRAAIHYYEAVQYFLRKAAALAPKFHKTTSKATENTLLQKLHRFHELPAACCLQLHICVPTPHRKRAKSEQQPAHRSADEGGQLKMIDSQDACSAAPAALCQRERYQIVASSAA
jgi:hypothetical protein